MRMKNLIAAASALCILFSAVSLPARASGEKLSIENASQPSGIQSLSFDYENADTADWVAIYAEGKSGPSYCDYQYIPSNGSGTVEFPSGVASRMYMWPLPDGDYTAVLYDNNDYIKITELAFSVGAEEEEPLTGEVFYVSESGSDETGNGTADKPYKTLMKASEAAGAENDAVFYVSGTASWKTIPHTGLYTIIGGGVSESTINMDGEVKLNGPVRYKDLKFYNNGSADWGDDRLNGNKWFVTNGYDLTLDGEIGFDRNNGAINPTKRIELGIGDTKDGDRAQRVILKAGDIEKISVGHAFTPESHPETGPIYLRFTGGATSASQDYWGLYGGIYFGMANSVIPNLSDVDLVLDKSISIKANEMYAFDGTLQLLSNNGADIKMPPLDKEPENGRYELYSPAGFYLDTTDEKGVFEVENTSKTAYVVSGDGMHVYYSVGNILTVPEPGCYDVQYVSELTADTVPVPDGASGWTDDGNGTMTLDAGYINDGEKIVFYKDVSLDLAGVSHKEYTDRLFVGWTDADGNAVLNNSEFKAGTELRAEYAELNKDTDFCVENAVYRAAAGETPEGLRFIVNVNEAFTEKITPEEYGAVAVPLEIAGIGDPELGKTFTYNGREYETGSIKADKILSHNGGMLKYSMCITDIEGKYMRGYEVRGYMKYSDLNGVCHTLYTDSFGANAYASVKDELDGGGLTEERRAELETAFDKMSAERAARKEAYTSQEKTDVKGSAADKTGWIYKLENGLMVREAEIDSGRGGDPVEIVQISDMHFNYCNEKDFIENNPAVMSTYENRTWNKNGSSFQNALRCVEYASFADQTVVTGDTLDYLSWGGTELMYKAVWHQIPDALIALGNHEPKRQMQGTVPDTASEEEIYSLLQSRWKHDIYYTSKILNDKVMIVVMDNQKCLYWEEQYDLLSDDITAARSMGIPILLFEHVAIPSQNPDEKALGPILAGDTSKLTYNFCDGDAYLLKYGMGDEATDKVYELIVNNGDVIRGIFCGDLHHDMYSEICAKTQNGDDILIPQYVLNGSPYNKGHVLKITVK